MKTLAISELIERFGHYTPEELATELSPEDLRDMHEAIAAIEHDQIEKCCAKLELFPIENCPNDFRASTESGCLYWFAEPHDDNQ